MLPISTYKQKNSFNNTVATGWIDDWKAIGKIRLKILTFFALLASALIFAQLVFANNLATDGNRLSQINEQIKKLEDENTTLRANIAQNSSLATLSLKAKSLGFEKPQKVIVP